MLRAPLGGRVPRYVLALVPGRAGTPYPPELGRAPVPVPGRLLTLLLKLAASAAAAARSCAAFSEGGRYSRCDTPPVLPVIRLVIGRPVAGPIASPAVPAAPVADKCADRCAIAAATTLLVLAEG